MSKFKKTAILIPLLLIAAFLLVKQYQNSVKKPQFEIDTEEHQQPKSKNVKTILYWTPMFGQKDFYLGLGSNIFQDCPVNNCYATACRTCQSLTDIDAILFHGPEYRVKYFGKPQTRYPRQVYVYSNQESPINTPEIYDEPDFFNWTMTYRNDSDIIRSYGILVEKQTEYVPDIRKIEKKTKLIAWMVSNCATWSKRELIYKELKKYVEIDVYGACGDYNCAKNQSDECYKMLEQYKFYLSFENSLCTDYVTEKLYNILKLDVVPVVYGGANYKRIAPPKSVINVMDFKSVKDLANYILFLDKNPKEYIKFFEWKRHFVVETSNKITLCSLCAKLNAKIKKQFYNNIAEWWRGKNDEQCFKNKNYTIL